MQHDINKTIFLYLDHSSILHNARKDIYERLYITRYYIVFSISLKKSVTVKCTLFESHLGIYFSFLKI